MAGGGLEQSSGEPVLKKRSLIIIEKTGGGEAWILTMSRRLDPPLTYLNVLFTLPPE